MVDARLVTESEFAAANGRRACERHEVSVCLTDDPGREELERFVSDVFSARHGARISSFMPTLLAMRNDVGGVCSVAGFRCASEQALFLERYLDQPIEHVLAASSGETVSRSQIVEVGNLASISCRSAMRLVLDLPRLLLNRGHRWMVFTATDTLRELLASYHAPLLDLGAAAASRAQDSGDDWGRYYESYPRVMAGCLSDGLSLRRRRK